MTLTPTTPSGFTGPVPSALLRPCFSVWVDDAQDAVVLHLQGELDVSTEAQFLDAMSTAMAAPGKTIVVDLAALSFVDSTGISAFMAAWCSAMIEGRTLCLRHPTRLVGKVLCITGFDRVLLKT